MRLRWNYRCAGVLYDKKRERKKGERMATVKLRGGRGGVGEVQSNFRQGAMFCSPRRLSISAESFVFSSRSASRYITALFVPFDVRRNETPNYYNSVPAAPRFCIQRWAARTPNGDSHGIAVRIARPKPLLLLLRSTTAFVRLRFHGR